MCNLFQKKFVIYFVNAIIINYGLIIFVLFSVVNFRQIKLFFLT